MMRPEDTAPVVAAVLDPQKVGGETGIAQLWRCNFRVVCSVSVVF